MTTTTVPAKALENLESRTKTYYITDPDGAQHPFVRISVEFSAAVEEPLLQELQNILWDAEERLNRAMHLKE